MPEETLPSVQTTDPASTPLPSAPSGDPDRYSRFITGLILFLLLIGVILGVLAYTSQTTFLAIVNAFWITIFCIVLLFLVLGVLVMVGLKDQVKEVLDIFVEGSLTVVDVMNLLKMAVQYIAEVIRQVIYFLVPVFSYLIGAVIYFLLIYAYKWVGKSYDVTAFTIFLSAVLIVATGFLNKRSKDEGKVDLSWSRKLQLRFKDYFGDAVEVVLFVFFLTMDSTHLFFLPKDLNVEIHASFDSYNFMVRGWTVDSYLGTTFNLVMAAVLLEILRFVIRIIAAGFSFYKEINAYIGESNQQMTGADQIKWALRQSFQVHKDDSIRFITYTTFIVAVFLAFPRLKLLAMATASLTAFIMDLAMHDRLVIKRGNDLFSKLVSFLFRV